MSYRERFHLNLPQNLQKVDYRAYSFHVFAKSIDDIRVFQATNSLPQPSKVIIDTDFDVCYVFTFEYQQRFLTTFRRLKAFFLRPIHKQESAEYIYKNFYARHPPSPHIGSPSAHQVGPHDSRGVQIDPVFEVSSEQDYMLSEKNVTKEDQNLIQDIKSEIDPVKESYITKNLSLANDLLIALEARKTLLNLLPEIVNKKGAEALKTILSEDEWQTFQEKYSEFSLPHLKNRQKSIIKFLKEKMREQGLPLKEAKSLAENKFKIEQVGETLKLAIFELRELELELVESKIIPQDQSEYYQEKKRFEDERKRSGSMNNSMILKKNSDI